MDCRLIVNGPLRLILATSSLGVVSRGKGRTTNVFCALFDQQLCLLRPGISSS